MKTIIFDFLHLVREVSSKGHLKNEFKNLSTGVFSIYNFKMSRSQWCPLQYVFPLFFSWGQVCFRTLSNLPHRICVVRVFIFKRLNVF